MKVAQRFYLLEVVSGLVLTAGHFFRNMGKHIAHAFGRKDARGAVTIQFPEERRPLAPRLRSLHRLVRREDGSPRCVACMMCETICPARCIYIVAEEHRLYSDAESGRLDDAGHQRLTAIRGELDRCWDLLRRRRADPHAGIHVADRRAHGQGHIWGDHRGRNVVIDPPSITVIEHQRIVVHDAERREHRPAAREQCEGHKRVAGRPPPSQLTTTAQRPPRWPSRSASAGIASGAVTSTVSVIRAVDAIASNGRMPRTVRSWQCPPETSSKR